MQILSNMYFFFYSCITAKTMRQYGIDHPNVRLKEVLSQDSGRGEARASHEGPFGRKTELYVPMINFVVATYIHNSFPCLGPYFTSAEESFGSIIQAKFTNFANNDADYPTITSIKKTGEMPHPKTTRAAQSILKAREDAIAQVTEMGLESTIFLKLYYLTIVVIVVT